MIVQQPENGSRAFVVSLDEHQGLAGQLAARFGNEHFESLTPCDPMLFAIAHHDAGWDEIDRSPPGDPATSLPCSLGGNPRELLLAAASRSVDFNERHHPFCGLLVSMHQVGLYNGRFGLKSAQLMGEIPVHERPQVDAFLSREATRQTRLRDLLRTDSVFRDFIEERALFFNYFRLQFFDRLALYLNRTSTGNLRPAIIDHVPTTIERQIDVEIVPLEDGLALDMYPFCEDEIVVAYRGRSVAPEVGVANWSERLAMVPLQERRFCLRRKIR